MGNNVSTEDQQMKERARKAEKDARKAKRDAKAAQAAEDAAKQEKADAERGKKAAVARAEHFKQKVEEERERARKLAEDARKEKKRAEEAKRAFETARKAVDAAEKGKANAEKEKKKESAKAKAAMKEAQDRARKAEEDARKAAEERAKAEEDARKAAEERAKAEEEAQRKQDAAKAAERKAEEAREAVAAAEKDKKAAEKLLVQIAAEKEAALERAEKAEQETKEEREGRRKAEAELEARIQKEKEEEEAKRKAKEIAERGTPTVVPVDEHSAEDDAMSFKKAMAGSKTDCDAITELVSKRSTEQLKAVAFQWKVYWGTELLDILKKKVPESYWTAVSARFQSPMEIEAVTARGAMKGGGTNEDILNSVICTKTNEQMKELIATFQRIYGRNLEKDVKSETSGNYRNILVSCLQAKRKSGEGDKAQAPKDAKEFDDALGEKLSKSLPKFIRALCLESVEHLRMVSAEFLKIASIDIELAIKEKFKGDAKNAFLTVTRHVRDPRAVWADLLHETKDINTLIRVLTSHCEKDLQDIKALWKKKYKTTLAVLIMHKTKRKLFQTQYEAEILQKLLLAITGQD